MARLARAPAPPAVLMAAAVALDVLVALAAALPPGARRSAAVLTFLVLPR